MNEALAPLFARPLICGASVSAGFGTVSPGKRLALRFTQDNQILTQAVSGAPGAEIEKLLSRETFSGRSVVVAMDFFFWDTTKPNATPALAALDRLLANAAAVKASLILGDVPELLPGFQPARREINARIHEAWAKPQVYGLELDALHQKIVRDGFVEIRGRRYSFRELVPDGLHLSPTAAEYLADFIADSFLQKNHARRGS